MSGPVRDPHTWWTELRHGGLLLSPVVLAEWLPDGPAPLDERRYRRLRDRFTGFQAKTRGGHDGPALHDWLDAVLEEFLEMAAPLTTPGGGNGEIKNTKYRA